MLLQAGGGLEGLRTSLPALLLYVSLTSFRPGSDESKASYAGGSLGNGWVEDAAARVSSGASLMEQVGCVLSTPLAARSFLGSPGSPGNGAREHTSLLTL